MSLGGWGREECGGDNESGGLGKGGLWGGNESGGVGCCPKTGVGVV